MNCLECRTPVPKNKVYCSRRCFRDGAARRIRERGSPRLGTGKSVGRNCAFCSSQFDTSDHAEQLYCSSTCHIEGRLASIWSQIERGEIQERKTLKRHLIRQRSHRCEGCRGTKWRSSLLEEPADIPLELDHIDGDAGNNLPVNLRLLCPNCHSVTSTAKGRNRGKGRASRNLPRN